MNPQKHICILRNKIIEDGLCFETVMAIQGMHSKKYSEKVIKEFPNAKKICNECKYNLER